jgi:diguanylate cyclase (GGDEF)-like protein
MRGQPGLYRLPGEVYPRAFLILFTEAGMGQAKRWRIELAGVLEWSAVEKGLALPVVLIPLYVQYILWAIYVLLREDGSQLADIVYLKSQTLAFLSFIAGALVLLAVGAFLRKRAPNALWYQHLCANYYSLTLVYCGYIIGSLSFSAGVVLVGAPLVGFILLERKVTYVSWSVALLAIVCMSYAGAVGLLQYAPALVPPTPGDPANQLFWTTSTLFFAAPHIISIVMLADFTLARWREREMAFRTLSFTDALTGVHNRRSILGILERELPRRQRMGPPVSVVLIDLDHFKKINDTWGHPVGDLVLNRAAKALDDCLRQSDAVGRYGGEEFLLVLAERCRQKLAALQILAENGEPVPVTGSFGVATNARDPEIGIEALVNHADEAMYRAKQGGRNRVETVV